MSGALTREAILNSHDIKVESVEIPEWNGVVWVKALSGEERDEFENGLFNTKRVRNARGKVTEKRELNMRKVRARLAVLVCVKSQTDLTPLFSKNDIDKLASKNGAALDKIYDAATRLAGMTQEELDDIEKKSQETHTVDNG